MALTAPVQGAFDCGSNGSDGALTFDAPSTTTVIEFDPASHNPPLDPDGDGVYHFTTVSIPALLTLQFNPEKVGWHPIYWLCQGGVVVNGTLDFSGANGHDASTTVPPKPSIPGPGGYPGGWGNCATFGIESHVGFGPGGSGLYSGNLFLLPLVGGNGGSGSATNPHTSGGGAGGGAFLLASNTSIQVNGSILAKGGNAGAAGYYVYDRGSIGAGGAVRLIAPTVSGTGTLSAAKGTSGTGTATAHHGVIRIESQTDSFTGTVTTDKLRRVSLLTNNARIFMPEENVPYAGIVRIGGVELPSHTSGQFTVPDVVLNTANPVLFEIEARNIPLGTQFTVSLWNETMYVIEFQTGGLTGTTASSTATASQAIPSGYTRGFVYATWTNP